MFEGLKTADPVAIGAVFTLTPLMSAAIARVLVGQRITPRMALALPAAGIGAAWVIFRADFDAILAFEIGRGEAIFLAGCVSYALYAPMVRKVHRGEPILSFTLLTFAAGIVFLVAYGWRDLLATQWAAVPWTVWLALAYLSFLASALTFLLIQFAALRLPAAKVMAYTFLTAEPCDSPGGTDWTRASQPADPAWRGSHHCQPCAPPEGRGGFACQGLKHVKE